MTVKKISAYDISKNYQNSIELEDFEIYINDTWGNDVYFLYFTNDYDKNFSTKHSFNKESFTFTNSTDKYMVWSFGSNQSNEYGLGDDINSLDSLQDNIKRIAEYRKQQDKK